MGKTQLEGQTKGPIQRGAPLGVKILDIKVWGTKKGPALASRALSTRKLWG